MIKINWFKVAALIPGFAGIVLIALNKFPMTGIFLFCLALFLALADTKKIVGYFIKKEEGKDEGDHKSD